MRKLPFAFLLIFSAMCGIGCEKVIHVHPVNPEEKVVIEAVLTNRAGGNVVMISEATGTDATSGGDGISGAFVTIRDSDGKIDTLGEMSKGIYGKESLVGTIGKTYWIFVVLTDGYATTAQSTMPSPVPIDTVFLKEDRANIHSAPRQLVNISYQDPADQANYYRFVQYVNGVRENEVFIRSDQLTNGNHNTAVLRYPKSDNNDIVSGDQIRVEMQCIDKSAYDYLRSMDRGALGDAILATPANPSTNFSQGALGYFTAHTVEERTFKAP